MSKEVLVPIDFRIQGAIVDLSAVILHTISQKYW